MTNTVKERYRGEFPASFDEKGRLNFPKEMRDLMDKNEHTFWCITRGFNQQLMLYPRRRWEEIEAQFDAESSLDPDIQEFRRFFLGGCSESKRDSMGRLTVPTLQRAYAGIEKKAVLLGVGDCLELWSEPAWIEYQRNEAGNYKAMAKRLFGRRNGTTATNEGAQGHES